METDLVQKTGDRVDDRLLLGAVELREDRNGQAFVGCPLGVREVAAAIAQAREAGLQGQRHRIVDLVADAGLVEMALERVASGRADDELIEDVPAVGRFGGQLQRPFASRGAKHAPVPRRVGPPRLGPSVQPRGLHPKNGGLQRIHPEVRADDVMVVPGLHAMGS